MPLVSVDDRNKKERKKESANRGGILVLVVCLEFGPAEPHRQTEADHRQMKGLIEDGDMNSKLHLKSRSLCVYTPIHHCSFPDSLTFW